MKDAMYIILHTGCLWFDMCKKSSAGRFFRPALLSIIDCFVYFLLPAALPAHVAALFLFVLFQVFLHNLLRHKPILHFRFGLAVLCMCSSVNGKIGLHGLNKCVSPSFLSQHHSILVVFENVYVLF